MKTPIKQVTVRFPAIIHDNLRRRVGQIMATGKRMSINQLVVDLVIRGLVQDAKQKGEEG